MPQHFRSYPSLRFSCPSHIKDAHRFVKDMGIFKKGAHPFVEDTHPFEEDASQRGGHSHPGRGGIGNIDKGMGNFENVTSILLKAMGSFVKDASIVVDDTHPFLRLLAGKVKNTAFFY